MSRGVVVSHMGHIDSVRTWSDSMRGFAHVSRESDWVFTCNSDAVTWIIGQWASGFERNMKRQLKLDDFANGCLSVESMIRDAHKYADRDYLEVKAVEDELEKEYIQQTMYHANTGEELTFDVPDSEDQEMPEGPPVQHDPYMVPQPTITFDEPSPGEERLTPEERDARYQEERDLIEAADAGKLDREIQKLRTSRMPPLRF